MYRHRRGEGSSGTETGQGRLMSVPRLLEEAEGMILVSGRGEPVSDIGHSGQAEIVPTYCSGVY